MKFGPMDGAEDEEYMGVGLVERSQFFRMQNVFIHGKVKTDRFYRRLRSIGCWEMSDSGNESQV